MTKKRPPYNGWKVAQQRRKNARELYVRMRARFDAGIATEVNYDELERYCAIRRKCNNCNSKQSRHFKY